MLVTMMAPGLALRGPGGSLVRCLDIVAEEYQSALVYFIAALVFFFASAILWSFSRGTHNAVSVTLIVVFFFACIYYTALRAMLRFDIPRGELVSGGFRQHRSPQLAAAHGRDRAATLPSRYVGADGRAYAPLRDEAHDEVPGAAAAAAVRHGMGQLAARLADRRCAARQPERRPLRRVHAAWQQATAARRPPRRPHRRRALAAAAPAARPPPPPPPPPSCTGRGGRRPRRSPRARSPREIARRRVGDSAGDAAAAKPSTPTPSHRTCRSRRWRRCPPACRRR